MIPVLSIVGVSNSGKTTLLERLVAELRRRGYRIATIKHSPQGFDLDPQATDSWRLTEAGSHVAMVSSPQRVALFQTVEKERSLEELFFLLPGNFDLIFTEGFKKAGRVKIEVHRQALGQGLVSSPSELFAIVTDEPLNLSVPQYSWDNAPQLASAIEEVFLSRVSREDEVDIFIDGLPVFLNPFMQDIFSRVMQAMLSTLKGVDMPKLQNAEVRLRRRGSRA